MNKRRIDVVGVGENATDIVMRVRVFPSPGGKERIEALTREAGGSVATALVACRRLGLGARYLGSIGDDENGRFQLASLRRERLDLSYFRKIRGARSRVSQIILDTTTGERVVLWERDPRLVLQPSAIPPDALAGARAVHLDATDLRASLRTAALAREVGIPVVADLDAVYSGIERLLPLIDYLIASSDFIAPATGERDPFRALERLAAESRARLVGVTLGRDGALVLSEGRFAYSPGFHIEPVDTTGAGDIFHGGFIYALVRGWNLNESLEFSNALAALNSTALGARGGIASESAARRLVARGKRNVNRDYAERSGH
ncbi:MAG TPA: PfkB family carbohydrate kinase [Terriglobia bacterium]